MSNNFYNGKTCENSETCPNGASEKGETGNKLKARDTNRKTKTSSCPDKTQQLSSYHAIKLSKKLKARDSSRNIRYALNIKMAGRFLLYEHGPARMMLFSEVVMFLERLERTRESKPINISSER